MTSIRPAHPLEVPDNVLRLALAQHHIYLGPHQPVAIVAVRGFAAKIGTVPEDTAGNQIGVYDDPISVVTPARSRTFTGNTDPSRTLEGRAILQVGAYELAPGIHNRTHPPAERRFAFVQASPVIIRRYDAKGVLGPELAGQWIGCNNHDGANTTTGSAACQTIAPEAWLEYLDEVLAPLGLAVSDLPAITARIHRGEDLPAHWAAARIPYVLTA